MRRLAALLLLLVLAAPAGAQPALFVARGPGVTAFLFGSLHVLPPGLQWQSPALQDAFDASGECWFEVELPGDPMLAVPAGMLLRGLDPARPLSTLLAPADRQRLRRRAEAAGIPGGTTYVDAMRPWLAWLVLTELGYRDAGLRSADGADQVLQARAGAAGKRIVPLETIEAQVDLVAGIPEREGLALLREAVRAPAGNVRVLRAMVADWRAGRIDRLERLVRELGRVAGPAFTERLLRRRNASWAARLGAEEGTGKTILVTVGAGHLVGRGNLRELLAARRWTVERVAENKAR